MLSKQYLDYSNWLQSYFASTNTLTSLECGCTVQRVAIGTNHEGVIRKYCNAHNPYKNTK